MTKTRKAPWFLFTAKAKADAESESRGWVAVCPHCALETSLWDLGGLRYKTNKTSVSYTGYKCARCGKFGMHRMVWKPELEAAAKAEIAARPAT